MAYTKTTWKDRAVQKPLTYTLQNNGDGTTTLIPAEGTIVEPGTAITAAVMNKLETQFDEALSYFQNQTQVAVSRSLTIGMASSGVDYKVFFDVENRDTQNEFASSVFTPKQSGSYLITVYATFNAVASGNTYVKLYKGGSSFATIGGVTNLQLISVSRIIYLTAGQTFEFYVAQNSGASQTMTSFSADIVKLT